MKSIRLDIPQPLKYLEGYLMALGNAWSNIKWECNSQKGH